MLQSDSALGLPNGNGIDLTQSSNSSRASSESFRASSQRNAGESIRRQHIEKRGRVARLAANFGGIII